MSAWLRWGFGPAPHLGGNVPGGSEAVVCRRSLTESMVSLDRATRGVDFGAKAGICVLPVRAAGQGMRILLASSERAELLGVCDRVIVLRGGRSVRELDTRAVSESDLLAASMGGLP